MFIRPVLVLLALASGCSSTPFRPDRPTILLTGFEPFGKWKVNLSYEVAREVRAKADEIGANIEVCRLPVEYDKGAAKAWDCLKNLPAQPTLIVSFGEGDCSIRLETGVTNLDHTPKFADNGGVIRTTHPILPGSANRVGFDLPIKEMYCSLPASDAPRVRLSVSAGNYVCNNTAYHLASKLRSEPIRYGFIHVPHSGCEATVRDPKENARIIAEMIKVALRKTDDRRFLPSTREEVMKTVKDTQDPCGVQFLESLLKAYPEKPGTIF